MSIVTALALAGCGSGGGESSSAAATQAVITLSTQGTPSTQPISGVQVTLTLPDGVTVAADQSGNTVSGVVKSSGTATGAVLTQGIYTPATSTTPGTVQVYLVKTDGFSVGDFATVTCNIANGSSPSSSSFSLADFTSFNATVDSGTGTVTNVLPISGLTPAYTAAFK